MEVILDKELEQDGKKITIKEALKSIQNDYYSDKLTKEEAEKKRRNIEKAIENEKKTLEELEKGLTNTLTNDYYFQNEINKINNSSFSSCFLPRISRIKRIFDYVILSIITNFSNEIASDF